MAIRFAYCDRIEKIPFDYDKMKGANKEQSPLTSVNGNTASLMVDPTLVKQFEYDLKIVKVSDIKDSANIKKYAKKLAILPIELGNLVQLKKLHDYQLNDDYNNVLLQIPIIKIQRAEPAEMITTHLLRDVKDLQIDIKFLDENENTQSMMLNVEDRYVNVICEKIDELKRVHNPRYWLRRDIPYKLGESTITVIIFPQTPFLAENEVVLWSNKKLNEITNKTIVKLQALTNFRIFEYEFEMHEGHYLLISDIEDIILTNKRWISHKNNDKGCIETTIVGDLTFINQGKQCITFSEINDPDSLTRLLKTARDHILLVRGNTNDTLLGMSSKVIICTQCGNANSRKSRACNQCGSKLLFMYSKCGHINPEGANFCNICASPLDGMPFADP